MQALTGGRSLDVLLAAVAVVATVAGRLSEGPSPAGAGPATVVPGLLLAVVVGGSLAWRRTAPLASYAVGTAALVVESLALGPSPVSPYANLVGVVSLGWFGSARRALWGPPFALVGIAAWFASPQLPAVVPVTVVLVWLASWALAYQVARRREAEARDRATRQREAVRDERTRIARELHDVVGHALSLMLVQVGAARTVLDERPAAARDLLLATERTGAETMAELDRVLGLLREDVGSDTGPVAGGPVDDGPGLADLDGLVARFGDAGLQVRLDRGPGVRAHYSTSTDLAVYRVVQEALTNALRHGRAATARVSLRCRDGELLVEVVDDGTGPAPGWEPGRGLLGVRERTGLLGGGVEHGAAPGGGFRLAVHLPVGAPS